MIEAEICPISKEEHQQRVKNIDENNKILLN